MGTSVSLVLHKQTTLPESIKKAMTKVDKKTRKISIGTPDSSLAFSHFHKIHNWTVESLTICNYFDS